MTAPVAFYAPLKAPDHPTPSGDRRMARALVAILRQGGRDVMVASRLRSFDRHGDRTRQERLKMLGRWIAERLIRRFQQRPKAVRPSAWITYHAYHKSPDWLGPVVCAALDMPYLLIETSFARKQAGGPWDLGHQATAAAVRAADITLAMTTVDEAGLAPLILPPGKLRRLPPFLDPEPYQRAACDREKHRRDLAERFGLDRGQPWLLAVGMMRDDVKRQSYALLAEAMQCLVGQPWQLLLVGDGVARPSVEGLFDGFGPKRVKYTGILGEDQLPACYAAADVYAWPAVNEAYGMALLEAQASGLPVVAGREGGVADIVQDGITGLLTPPRDVDAVAGAIVDLLDHPEKRSAMSDAASRFIAGEHSVGRAAAVMDQALIDAAAIQLAKTAKRQAIP